MSRQLIGRAAFAHALLRGGSVATLMASAIGVVQFYRPAPAPVQPFAALANRVSASPSLNAFGRSRAVQLRFALPGDTVEFPLQVNGDPSTLAYQWTPVHDSIGTGLPQPLDGATFVAPSTPGFYHLVLMHGSERQVLPEPTLAVMVPYAEKQRGSLNGYRIGTYLADRLRAHDRPEGFLEVRQADLDLHVSNHLRLGDFITHDDQRDVWPKYVALNPRILDKIELVLDQIGQTAHLSHLVDGAPREVALDVHSGFRTPAHNRTVRHAARDSRHEYGDAADVAIDANGDGRVTLTDEVLVARAVDEVESAHPDLVGGMGLYISRRYRTPYVHIDARGTRSRWKG